MRVQTQFPFWNRPQRSRKQIFIPIRCNTLKRKLCFLWTKVMINSSQKFVDLKIKSYYSYPNIQKPKKLLLKELYVHLPSSSPPTSDCFEVAREQALLRQESRRAMQAFKRSAKGAHVWWHKNECLRGRFCFPIPASFLVPGPLQTSRTLHSLSGFKSRGLCRWCHRGDENPSTGCFEEALSEGDS